MQNEIIEELRGLKAYIIGLYLLTRNKEFKKIKRKIDRIIKKIKEQT